MRTARFSRLAKFTPAALGYGASGVCSRNGLRHGIHVEAHLFKHPAIKPAVLFIQVPLSLRSPGGTVGQSALSIGSVK